MVNTAHLLGRVGKIETKTVSSGLQITNLSMVTSKKITRNGQKEEKITWHNVTIFNKLSEIAEKYVGVGDLLYIQGEIDNQKYTGTDGQERVKHFIIAHELKLMPKTKEQPKSAPTNDNKSYEPSSDDDIPF